VGTNPNSPPCGCVDTSWSPNPNTICLNQSFTQTSNCGNTRPAVGTNPNSPPCPAAGTYTLTVTKAGTGSGTVSSGSPPPSNPVANWKFDETSGTTALDSSGNGNTGTLVNGPSWTAGKVNNALNFDGVNDYVNAGSPSSLNDMPAKTIVAWIKPISFGGGGYGRIFDKNQSGTNQGWNLFFPGSANLRFSQYFSITNGYWDSAQNSIVLNTWQHVAVVYDRASASNVPKFYVNGNLLTISNSNYQSPSGSASSDASQPLTIGGRTAGDRSFNGNIDEVYVYNRALTQAEIQSLYNAGGPSINCGPACPSASAVYSSGASVTLTASASTGLFTGWSGDCSGANPTSVTMNSNKTCTATFNVANQAPVAVATISKDGVNYSDSVSVTQGVATPIYLSANYNNAGTVNAGSSDPDGWTNATNGVSTDPGRCEWNSNLDKQTSSPWSSRIDQTVAHPAPNAGACNISLGNITFSDDAGPQTYEILRIVDRQGAQSATIDTVSVTVQTILNVTNPNNGNISATGINCGNSGTDCSETYSGSQNVTLTATPSSGYTLSWGGDCLSAGSNSTCTVNMARTKNVSVTFTAISPIATITASPNPVSYNSPSTITWSSANATACTASGSWSGAKAVSGSQSTGNLTTAQTYTINCTGPGGSDTKSVTVNVTPPAQRTLQVNIVSGSGTVNETSPGSTINCPSACSGSYANNTLVTLTATPSSLGGSVTWGGNGSSCAVNNINCAVTMDSNKNVTVTFGSGGFNWKEINPWQ